MVRKDHKGFDELSRGVEAFVIFSYCVVKAGVTPGRPPDNTGPVCLLAT
ncbi:MAG: hypothetical protein JO170_06175 [Verrucomicrobia bacterium]|nr:hypothetical protein [Verrucomicrobiota bacterium]